MHAGQLAHRPAQTLALVLRVLLPGGEHRGQVPDVHAGGCGLLPAGGSSGPPARQQAGECLHTLGQHLGSHLSAFCPRRWRCARHASATSCPSAATPSPRSSSATWSASSSSASTSGWTRPPWPFSWTITPTASPPPAAPVLGSPPGTQTGDLHRRCVS